MRRNIAHQLATNLFRVISFFTGSEPQCVDSDNKEPHLFFVDTNALSNVPPTGKS